MKKYISYNFNLLNNNLPAISSLIIANVKLEPAAFTRYDLYQGMRGVAVFNPRKFIRSCCSIQGIVML